MFLLAFTNGLALINLKMVVKLVLYLNVFFVHRPWSTPTTKKTLQGLQVTYWLLYRQLPIVIHWHLRRVSIVCRSSAIGAEIF